jgi:Fe-S cluster biogenesis protein NfuA
MSKFKSILTNDGRNIEARFKKRVLTSLFQYYVEASESEKIRRSLLTNELFRLCPFIHSLRIEWDEQMNETVITLETNGLVTEKQLEKTDRVLRLVNSNIPLINEDKEEEQLVFSDFTPTSPIGQALKSAIDTIMPNGQSFIDGLRAHKGDLIIKQEDVFYAEGDKTKLDIKITLNGSCVGCSTSAIATIQTLQDFIKGEFNEIGYDLNLIHVHEVINGQETAKPQYYVGPTGIFAFGPDGKSYWKAQYAKPLPAFTPR